jgi:hypothetical protein
LNAIARIPGCVSISASILFGTSAAIVVSALATR